MDEHPSLTGKGFREAASVWRSPVPSNANSEKTSDESTTFATSLREAFLSISASAGATSQPFCNKLAQSAKPFEPRDASFGGAGSQMVKFVELFVIRHDSQRQPSVARSTECASSACWTCEASVLDRFRGTLAISRRPERTRARPPRVRRRRLERADVDERDAL